MAVAAEQHEDLPSLLRRADAAMYEAKRQELEVRLHDAAGDRRDEVDVPSPRRAPRSTAR